MGAYLFRLAKLEEASLPPRALTFTSSLRLPFEQQASLQLVLMPALS
jgi:hypothetical protein